MAQLLVRIGDGKDQVKLGQTTVTLGRDPSNHIQIPDNNASRRHSQIELAGPGRYRVSDLGSRNGTLVNDLPVLQQELHDGDRIRVGPAMVTFQSEQPVTEEERHFLTVQEPERPIRTFELDRDTVTVGHHPCNRLVLRHESVTNRHGELRLEGTHLRYKDLGSTNGSLLDGELVDEAEVGEGRELEIGAVKFRYHRAANPGEIFKKAATPQGAPALQAPQPRPRTELSPGGTKTASASPPPPRSAAPALYVTAGLAALLCLGIAAYKFWPDEQPATAVISIRNAGFEETAGSTSLPRYWTFKSAESVSVELVESADRPGRSLKIEQSEATPPGAETPVVCERANSELPHPMALTAAIKRESNRGLSGFRFEWTTSSQPDVSSVAYYSAGEAKEWTDVALEVVPPLWADGFRLGCVAVGTQSRTWFDDISLAAVPQAGPGRSMGLAAGRRMHIDETGRLTLQDDRSRVLFWDAGLATGGGQQTGEAGQQPGETGQQFMHRSESPAFDGSRFSQAGAWPDFESGENVRVLHRVERDESACKVRYVLSGNGLGRMAWAEFRLNMTDAILDLMGRANALGASGTTQMEPSLGIQDVEAAVWGDGEARLTLVFPQPVTARCTKLGEVWQFAFRTEVTPRETEFELRLQYRSQTGEEEVEKLVAQIGEAKARGELPLLLDLYQELQKCRPYDPEVREQTVPEIRKLAQVRRELDQESVAALAGAEKSRQAIDIRYANRLFQSLLEWVPDAEKKGYEETREKLAVLMVEAEKQNTEREAKEICGRAKDFREKGKNLLATQCLKYVLEQFPESAGAGEARALLGEIGDD